MLYNRRSYIFKYLSFFERRQCFSSPDFTVSSLLFSISFIAISKAFQPAFKIALPVAEKLWFSQITETLVASYRCGSAVARINFAAIRLRIFLSPSGRSANFLCAISAVGIIAW